MLKPRSMTPLLVLSLASLPAAFLGASPVIPSAPISGPAVMPAQRSEAPPGLVRIKGGTTKVGTPVKVVEELIKENESMANALVAETPMVSIKVDDFYVMPTEVTNEQYAVYVEFAQIKPPYNWADADALEAARRTYLEERGKAAKEAREQGKTFKVEKFDPEKWWKEAWESTPWSVPDALAEHPAVFVDYEAALAYATWAGLRLPTEEEWTRAARGNSDDTYPWGDDEASSDKANTVEQPYSEARPVGSYPNGARDGIFDLSGNVWEWTSSPFKSLKGYKPLSVKVGKGKQARTIEALAEWDPSFRVLKGGAFPNTLLAARVATRMGAIKSQSTEALGFRCAASSQPGRDAAAAVLMNDVVMSAMPPGVNFNPDRAVILQRWKTKPGKVSERIDTYSIITAHQQALFMPVTQIEENSVKNLASGTIEEPIVFGLLSVSVPMMSPNLDAGTYVMAYRAAGDLPKVDPKANPDQQPTTLRFTEAEGFDPDQDQYFFFDGEGNPMATLPAAKPLFEKKAAGRATWQAFEAPKRPDKKNPVTPMDKLRFKAFADSSNSRKGFAFDLTVGVQPGLVDDSWK